jgi:hypothetical protein
MLGPRIATAVVAGAALCACAVSPALASVQVTFFNYDGSSIGTQANQGNAILGATADATFSYSGAINWSTSDPLNLVSDFLTIGDVSGFSSPSGTYASIADFGAATLSVSGDTITSFFQISGSGIFGSGSISHDDGATLYLDGSSTPIVNSAAETNDITNTFATTLGLHTYVLDYVEGNGSPSVLEFTTGVPEPATWAMMLLGFAGLGFAGYRRTKKSDATFAAA